MVTAECSMIHSVYLLRASTSSSTLWEIGSNREDSGDIERGKDFIGCSVHQSHRNAATLPAYNTEAELEYTVILAKQCYIRKRLDSHKFLKYMWSRRTHRGYSKCYFLSLQTMFFPPRQYHQYIANIHKHCIFTYKPLAPFCFRITLFSSVCKHNLCIN